MSIEASTDGVDQGRSKSTMSWQPATADPPAITKENLEGDLHVVLLEAEAGAGSATVGGDDQTTQVLPQFDAFFTGTVVAAWPVRRW